MAYRIPNTFSSTQQISALLTELEKLKPEVFALPQKWPSHLQEFAQINALGNLTVASQSKLISFVKEVLASSPQLSLIVASMPNNEDLSELTGWFRSYIHPHATLHIAQNSDLLAGCILRTKDKVYDFSLRSSLFANSAKLVERLQHA